MGRRILMLPFVRLVITLVIFAILGSVLSLAALLLGVSTDQLLGAETVSGLAALGALLFVGTVVERRPLAKIGFPSDGALRDLGLGLLLGAALLTLVVGGLALAGWYQVIGFAWNLPGENVVAVVVGGLLLTALIAVSEEVLLRGIFFRILEEGVGSWIAVAISALVFGLLHVTNPNASLWAGIAVALEAGVLFGAVYIHTRSLWMPIGLHWTWNFFEGWVFGTPVSGIDITGLLRSTTEGPTLWTGGSFGPEAGLIAVFICGAAGVLILVRCAREGRIFTPPWLARLTRREPSR
jgi:uncharacterized protein